MQTDFGKKILKIGGYITAITLIWGALTGSCGYVIEKIYHKEITDFYNAVEFAKEAKDSIIPSYKKEIKEIKDWQKKKSKTKAIGLRKNIDTGELWYRAGGDLKLYRAYYKPEYRAYYYDYEGESYECH